VFNIGAMEALTIAIKLLGSQSAIAAALGVAPQVVNNWLRRRRVPADHCPAIERVTGGSVRCEDLRPDVDWAYLRGSAVGPNASADRGAA
jgi:DNA-binding transcriptional regulator YdaS (Cro superfamily)